MNSFIVNSKSLLSALNIASKAVVKNAVVPIIESYLFQVTGNRLTISGTDFQTTLRAILPIEGNNGNFACVVSPSIVKYLQKLDEQPVIIESHHSSKEVKDRHGKVVLQKDGTPEISHSCSVVLIDEDGRAKYDGENPQDFPTAPVCKLPLMTVQTDFVNEFKDLLNYAGTDELRPAMTGINCAKFGSAYELTATDGHRIKTVDVSDLATFDDELTPNFILPAKPAKILSGMKIKEALKISVKRTEARDASADAHAPCEYREITNVMFQGTVDGVQFELIARAIDERYPDYKNVIPSAKNARTHLTLSKKPFLKLIDKALLFANKHTHQIKISLNGKNLLSAEDLDFKNEFSAVMPESTYKGDEIEIGFNAEFIKEICAGVSDKFTFEFSAPNKAGVIRDGRAIILVMPVMLNQYV
jgi:DNA polymerase-3 subunit beta